MKIKDRTVLITGGSSGIGLEFARQLSKLGAKVIITGRDKDKLDFAARSVPNATALVLDVNDVEAIANFANGVSTRYPELSVVISNAGIMRARDVGVFSGDLQELTSEIETNLNGPIRLITALLPHLQRHPSAAIVNVSSGIAFLPMPAAPIYSAAKAGLHAWTLCLRMQLAESGVQVFEVAPPLTRTPLGVGTFDPAVIEGIPFMEADQMVAEAIKGIRKDRLEIRPGMSATMKMMGRLSPNWLLQSLLTSSIDRMRKVGHAN